MDSRFYIYKHIQFLLKCIEDNLTSDLDIKTMSCFGNISTAQLYRDFYSVTGHSVKEYLRKRRLSNALALIKASDKTITQIAYECGFSSQSALCRALKQAMNMTPLEYKTSGVFYFFSPFNGHAAQKIVVSTKNIPVTCCLKYYHQNLTGIENNAIKHFFEFVPDYSGRLFGRNGKQLGTKFCYELYISNYEQFIDILKTSEFNVVRSFPAYKAMFATNTVENDEIKINAGWDYLYSDWLPGSMFELTELPYFEEYIIKHGAIKKLNLHLPIRKTNKFTAIKIENNPQLHFVVSSAMGYFAERCASRTVIDYLVKKHPYVVNSTKEFYMRKGLNNCVCGVRVGSELHLDNNKLVSEIKTVARDYVVLYSDSLGIYEKCCDTILTFAHNNGIHIDCGGIFAVYDTSNGYDRPKMRMYTPIIRR